MSRLINLPTFELCLAKPVSFEVAVSGNSIDGGRDGNGMGLSSEMSGGGALQASFDCVIKHPEQHEYLNWLAARLGSGTRYINVPLRTDYAGPFPIIDGRRRAIVDGIPHSDGALFSDDSGYSQATVWGEITANRPLNSGILNFRLFNEARPLRWSDWFSIYHPTKGWRAYRYWEVQARTSAANPVYQLAISPPLREAVTIGTRVEFARPRFVGKFPPGFVLPWRKPVITHLATPTIEFVEAMR
jgi:hypothetical protein